MNNSLIKAVKINRSAKANRLFIMMKEYIHRQYSITNDSHNPLALDTQLSHYPQDRLSILSQRGKDMISISVTLNLAAIWQVEWEGFDSPSHATESNPDALLAFIRTLLPKTAKIDIITSHLSTFSDLEQISVVWLCEQWTPEAQLAIDNLFTLASIPETTDDALFQLMDEQTGQQYQVSVQKHNSAGIAIVVPGFSHATSPDDFFCVAWLEAYDGKLMLRVYNDPEDDGPNQSIELIPTAGLQ
jgi:hypothetical protein